jgi:hypothetical protein
MKFDNSATRARTIEIGADKVISFDARLGQEVLCTRGYLWITQDGDPRDVFVVPGQRFFFDRRGVAVVHAMHAPGAFMLARVREPRGAWLARIAEALRARFARPSPAAGARRVSPAGQRTSGGRLAQTLT